MLSTKIGKSLPRPNAIQPKCIRQVAPTKRSLTVKALPFDLEYSSYIIGKGIIVFTFTYCTLNWLTYKQTRKEVEKDKKKK